MGARCSRAVKKDKVCEASIDTLIERMKKIRALNCNPSDVGLDGYVWKKFFSYTRSGLITRSF